MIKVEVGQTYVDTAGRKVKVTDINNVYQVLTVRDDKQYSWLISFSVFLSNYRLATKLDHVLR